MTDEQLDEESGILAREAIVETSRLRPSSTKPKGPRRGGGGRGRLVSDPGINTGGARRLMVALTRAMNSRGDLGWPPAAPISRS